MLAVMWIQMDLPLTKMAWSLASGLSGKSVILLISFSDWSGYIDGLPARYECINRSDVINKRQDVILFVPE